MWSLKTILGLRTSAASRWSAPSQVKGRGFAVAPFPSSAMSLGLGIPWQVALQQSLPPLPQPEPLCNNKDRSVEQFSADGTCLTDSVSQNRPQSTIQSNVPQAPAHKYAQILPVCVEADPEKKEQTLQKAAPAGNDFRRRS
jgi:hypothetical protein